MAPSQRGTMNNSNEGLLALYGLVAAWVGLSVIAYAVLSLLAPGWRRRTRLILSVLLLPGVVAIMIAIAAGTLRDWDDDR